MQEYEHAQAYHSVLVQDVKFLNAVERKRIVAKENQVVDAFAKPWLRSSLGCARRRCACRWR